MNFKNTLTILLISVSLSGFSQDWKTYPHTPSGGSLVSFPADEGRHTDPVEWWYTSGHFTGDTSGKEYSFMLTYFYYPQTIGIFNFDGFRILNVTDEATGTFYQDTKPVNYTTLSTTGFEIEASLFPTGTEYWKNKLDTGSNPIPFEYELSASSNDVSMTFDLETTKRPLILDGDGYFLQGLSNYTYYYSQTNNTITGSFTIGGSTENVTGNAWIDRQYGDFNPFTGENYEWFSIQLSNGTDINFWNVFNAADEIPENSKYKLLSAYVDESNQYTITDFEIERLEYFFTPDNLRCYSKKWRLTSTSKNLDLIITANHTTTEVDITEISFLFYEGAVTISGTDDGNAVTGVGFAELLHKYEHPDVSLTNPSGGAYNTSDDITWTLNNSDTGRPLKYDLEYSINNQATFLPIASGLTTTSYSWDGTGINDGDDIWIKVKAYSIDNVLNSEVISSSSSSVTLSTSNLDKNVMKFYPNPVKDELKINFKEAIYGVLEIVNINGKSIYTVNLNNNFTQNIETQFLSQGVYFLKLNSNKGEEVIKFVKE